MNKLFRSALKSLVVLTLLVLAISAPIVLQRNATAQADESASAKQTTKLPAKPAAQHGQTAWTYSFADKPNGPVSKSYFNFESGTDVSNYNDEQQAYTGRTSNVRVENGVLVIEAKPEAYAGKAYTSARINTKEHFDFTYGTLEVDMKLPSGVGSWPAAWLLPAQPKYSGSAYGVGAADPFSWALNGEVDFAEAVGYIPGQNIPATHSYNEVQQAPTYTPAYIPDSATTFHRYGVVKTPTKITFTIDGIPYTERVKTGNSALDWPFDQPYYLILNLAVGGKWAGDKGVDPSSMPWQLQVRSINYSPKY